MRGSMLHIADALAVTAGAALLIGGLLGFSEAEAALPGNVVLTPDILQPVIILLGFLLVTLPLTRRVAYHSLMDPGAVAECGEVGRALERIALMQRVQAGNLYIVDLSEEGLERAFESPEALWSFMRPAYQDPSLRRQIHPELLSRLDSLADKEGRMAQG